MTYTEFLASKQLRAEESGFELDPVTINPAAFDYQRDIITWACKKGKCAVLTGCGSGKTMMQLEWCRAVHEHTGKPVLIVAPLNVVEQTRVEGEKFGIAAVTVCRTGADVRDGVNITNYEMIEHFDPSVFAGVCLDESSILKSYTGKYQAVKMGRKGIGIELKPAYFQAAVENVKNAELELDQETLFDLMEVEA